MSKYNATVYQLYPDNPQARGTFIAKVEMLNGRLQMLRANSPQFTGFEDQILGEDIPELGAKKGDAAYNTYLEHCAKKLGYYFEIELDECEGYRNALRGSSLPPAYQV